MITSEFLRDSQQEDLGIPKSLGLTSLFSSGDTMEIISTKETRKTKWNLVSVRSILGICFTALQHPLSHTSYPGIQRFFDQTFAGATDQLVPWLRAEPVYFTSFSESLGSLLHLCTWKLEIWEANATGASLDQGGYRQQINASPLVCWDRQLDNSETVFQGRILFCLFCYVFVLFQLY